MNDNETRKLIQALTALAGTLRRHEIAAGCIRDRMRQQLPVGDHGVLSKHWIEPVTVRRHTRRGHFRVTVKAEPSRA